MLRQLGDERLRKLVGLERDGFQLVGESLESVGEERHEHRLGRVPKLGVQGAEEAKSSRAPVGRLLRLVRDHRLERGQRRVDLHEVSLGELVHDGLALGRAVLWRGSRQELGGVDGRHGASCLGATLRAQAGVQAPVSQIVRLVLLLLLLCARANDMVVQAGRIGARAAQRRCGRASEAQAQLRSGTSARGARAAPHRHQRAGV